MCGFYDVHEEDPVEVAAKAFGPKATKPRKGRVKSKDEQKQKVEVEVEPTAEEVAAGQGPVCVWCDPELIELLGKLDEIYHQHKAEEAAADTSVVIG